MLNQDMELRISSPPKGNAPAPPPKVCFLIRSHPPQRTPPCNTTDRVPKAEITHELKPVLRVASRCWRLAVLPAVYGQLMLVDGQVVFVGVHAPDQHQFLLRVAEGPGVISVS